MRYSTRGLAVSVLALLQLALVPLDAQQVQGGARGAGAPLSRLGAVAFPNSGAAAAQEPFIRGVALLHSFEYDEAREAFREAQRTDSSFALAYWGEALSHFYLLWTRENLTEARRALERLGKTPAARLARAPTAREKDYLRALEPLLYAGARLPERVVAYGRAMERLVAEYPGDPEAAAFAAVAINAGARWLPVQERAARREKSVALAEQVFAANPDHPGAAHYLIHLFDATPERARRALPAALRYAEIAPDAAHAHHMPSHVFNSLGMWEHNIASNTRALEVTQRGRATSALANPEEAVHSTLYLEYAQLQLGRWGDATVLLDSLQRWFNGFDFRGHSELVQGEVLGHLMLYAVETERWSVLESIATRLDPDSPVDYERYLAAVVAMRRGDTATLRSIVRRGPVSGDSADWPAGMRLLNSLLSKQFEAFAALHLEGDAERAIAALSEAAALEERTTSSAPPHYLVSHDLLAAALLERGRVREAVAVYERALAHRPNRSSVLLRLARARASLGDQEGASAAYQQLLDNWKTADPDLPALEEARRAARRGAENGTLDRATTLRAPAPREPVPAHVASGGFTKPAAPRILGDGR